jgi:asparagine synthase (glutamine-hydrolysing)
MMQSLGPRGPDASGKWTNSNQNVFLGHQRLSIIGSTDAGAQPMHSHNLRYTISFNGEIYNYRELAQELAAHGVMMRGDSDTEVLLELYSVFGVNAFPKLRGMFALAIWDDLEKSLTLARDTFGMKPLYCSIDSYGLLFSSQIKSLLRSKRVSRDINLEGHASYLIWGHMMGGETLFENIFPVKPGSWIKVKEDGVCQSEDFFSIYDLYSTSKSKSSSVTLRDLLVDTVEHHLVADVPVGIFLSSGIDSSVLLAATAELGVRPKTITLGFEDFRGTSLDESVLAEKLAKYYGAEHETIFLSQKEIVDSLDDFFEAMDQPSTDGLNTWLVSRVAHKLGFKAVLSGVGADEFFGGYPSFWQVPKLLGALGPLAKIPELGKVLRKITYPALKRVKRAKYAGMLEYSNNLTRAYFLRRAQIMPFELQKIYGSDIDFSIMFEKGTHKLAAYEKITEEQVEKLRSIGGNFMAISYLEASNYMSNRLLVDSDWASMSNSLEIRMPFVDAIFVAGIIEQMKIGKPFTKQDLASSLKTPLPDEIRFRRKTGFAVPVQTKSQMKINVEAGGAFWSKTALDGYMNSVA